MTAYFQSALDANYTIHGVDAVLTIDGTDSVPVTVLDKSAGVALGDSVEVQTIKPAACVRVSELTERGIAREDLPNATIAFNDGVWTIDSTLPRVTPNGEVTGELFLLLSEAEQTS